MFRTTLLAVVTTLSLTVAVPAMADESGVEQEPIASSEPVGKRVIEVDAQNPTGVRLAARFCSDYTVVTRRSTTDARAARFVRRTRTACDTRNLAPFEVVSFRMTGRTPVEVEKL